MDFGSQPGVGNRSHNQTDVGGPQVRRSFGRTIVVPMFLTDAHRGEKTRPNGVFLPQVAGELYAQILRKMRHAPYTRARYIRIPAGFQDDPLVLGS